MLKITKFRTFKTPLCNHHSPKSGHIPGHVISKMINYLKLMPQAGCFGQMYENAHYRSSE